MQLLSAFILQRLYVYCQKKKKKKKLGNILTYFQDEHNVLTKLLNLYLSFQGEYNVFIKKPN